MSELPLEAPLPRTLLIIEGDPAFSEALAAMAAGGLPGTVPVRAATLEEGLGSLRGGGIDLVLLGPGKEGGPDFPALDRIRREEGSPAIVLLMEGCGEDPARAALRMGAQDCLARADLTPDVLARSLGHAIERNAWRSLRRLESEHLLACTLDSMRAAIAITDENGIIIATNAPWRDQEAAGNPLIPPMDKGTTDFASFCRNLAGNEHHIAAVACGFLAVLSGAESRFVSDFLWGEGPGARGFGVTFHRFVADGRLRAGIAIADITVRIRTEQRLHENQEMFRIISENAGDLVALIDRDGRGLFQNLAHGRSLGFTMEELREFPPMFLFHPDDRDRLVAELGELFASGQDSTTQFRMLHKNGTWRHFEGRAAVVPRGDSTPDRVIVVSRDITERLKADTELLKAHAIKNLILENSTLGIVYVRKRVFEWANARTGEILGRPLSEILGAPTRLAYPDDASYDEMGRSTYAALERGKRADVNWQLVRGDGSLFWCRMIGRPLDPAKPNEGSVWLMEDTTEKRKVEQERLFLEVQLRHAQKLEAIGQLAAGIAHEINTPTQYIGDNTKFLAEAFQDLLRVVEAQEGLAPQEPEDLARILEEADLPYLKEEIPRAIEQSQEGIARVTRIVKAMKDFSHPGSEDPLEVDLNRSIESTITVSRNEWKYVANLALDLDPALPPVLCYPNEINQAVLNLLVNAAHAIADAHKGDPEIKGTITVSTSHGEGMAEIRVRDTGTGIPEHVRPRIFDPFFTTKEVGKGTGQGLAIVHTVVVERHRGSVGFETETGRGSVFILRIPLAGNQEGGPRG